MAAELRTGLGPLTEPRLPAARGHRGAGRRPHRQRSVAEPDAGAAGAGSRWSASVMTRFLASPMSFDSAEGRAGRLVRRGRRARRPRSAVATSDRRRHRGGTRRGAGCRCRASRPASVDARGSTPYFGVATDGTRYFVKALGDDQRSADLLFRLYRSIQRHDLGDERPFSSLRRAVEHEAFVALAARDLGILTPRIARLRLRRAERLRARLRGGRRQVARRRARRSEITDDVLADIWQAARTPAVASASPTATSASPTSSSAATARSG